MIKPNPTSERKTSGSDGHPGLYCLIRKLAPQCTKGLNFKKFSHLRISGSFDGGRELKKKWPLAALHGKSGNGHCPWKTMFESENFLFHRTEGSNCEMFEITWQVSTWNAVLHWQKRKLISAIELHCTK